MDKKLHGYFKKAEIMFSLLYLSLQPTLDIFWMECAVCRTDLARAPAQASLGCLCI